MLGFRPEVILSALPDIEPLCVVNPSYPLGQLSSLHVGLDSVGEVDAILMFLADHPFIPTSVINSLIGGYEDSGRPINPLIVDGQIHGAIAQGLGGALYEHLVYDENGQLLSGSLVDYLLPGSTEVPPLELQHINFPSPTTLKGIRGAGEGGTLGPAAAIANAVSDALVPFDVEVNDLPVVPHRLRRAVTEAARRGRE